jgi:hypothetical protein
MRFFQFGLFDAQAADMNADSWGGRSALVWDNNSANQQDGSPIYNSANDQRAGYGSLAEAYHNLMLVSIALDQIKATLGQIPVLVKSDLTLVHYAGTSSAAYLEVFKMYTAWDIGDSDNRYSDISALTTWYQDAYHPYPGQDRSADYLFRTETKIWSGGERAELTITDIVERALRDNTDILMAIHGYTGSSASSMNFHWKPTDPSLRPTLESWYLYPIEFYEDSGGDIDLSSTVQEGEDGHYYLGAVERDETGTAVKCWARNYTGATQQVEFLDDHPEWSTPVQRAGTGAGELDYVVLSETSDSQKYTVVFYSATQYEVKAEAYRDNTTSHHPQINADASWRGAVGSDFTSPSGGLTIPSAAWQSAGIVSGDEFEIGVRGNTTDTSWPADSNDQVEITYDDSGSADSSGWRPVTAHREKLADTVAVDATSKFFPIRHMVAADWPIGNKILVHDATNMDEGTVSSVQERALDSAAHTGSGLDDCTESGNYNGTSNKQFRVEVDGTGTPDTFKWSNDGGSSWEATGVAMTGSAQLLEDGVYVTFGATTGHTSGDRWDFDADTWGITVGGLSAGSNSYAAGSYLTTALPLRDFAAAVWSTIDQDSGVSQTPSSRIYLSDTSGFTAGDDVFIQQVGTGEYEEGTIAAGGVQSSYIDITTSLTLDYSDGDFVTKKGTGEEPFWMRPVADSTTAEELKRFRLNARML